MESLRIGQWINRYPGGDAARVVEKVSADVVDATLADAVDALSLDPGEFICLKELRVPVRLDTWHSTRSLSRAWSRSFAGRLERALRNGEGVVRYRSAADAHIACAEGVLAGDLSALWAWRRLGLMEVAGTASDAGALDAWCRGSRSRGVHQFTVWRHLLGSPRLLSAALRLSPRQWRMHLDALGALLRCDLPAWLEDRDAAPAREAAAGAGDGALPGPLEGAEVLAALRQAASPARDSLIVLALAVAEPCLFHAGSTGGRERIAHLRRCLQRAPAGGEPRGRVGDPAAADGVPESARTGAPARRAAARPDSMDGELGSTREGPGPPRPGPDRVDGSRPAPAIGEDAGTLRTGCGGLFYLFNVIQQFPEFIPGLFDEPKLRHAPAPWTWYWLARAVTGGEDGHTAALVFAGASDQRDAKPLSGLLPEGDQAAVLARHAGCLLERFRLCLLEAGGAPDLEPAGHLRVNAAITLDPGWIEVVYALQDVDILVRRAGLDRNPDFLPWLGRVVRFVYG